MLQFPGAIQFDRPFSRDEREKILIEFARLQKQQEELGLNAGVDAVEVTVPERTDFSQEAIEAANETSSGSSCGIGPGSSVVRLLTYYCPKSKAILDFGAGKDAPYTRALRRQGYSVTAYEFGQNVSDFHDARALSRQYPVVFAQGVLNTQKNRAALQETLRQLSGAVASGGSLLADYPQSPRLMDLSAGAVEGLLRAIGFRQVRRVGGTAAAPIWIAQK
jgi:hypothetical protein